MDISDYKVVAKAMMQKIQLDNGYGHVEGISYPSYWVNKIAKACMTFFELNPDKFTDEDIENISIGGDEDSSDVYGYLEGWDSLDRVLYGYFDRGMSLGVVEEKPRLMYNYKRNKGSHK